MRDGIFTRNIPANRSELIASYELELEACVQLSARAMY